MCYPSMLDTMKVVAALPVRRKAPMGLNSDFCKKKE